MCVCIYIYIYTHIHTCLSWLRAMGFVGRGLPCQWCQCWNWPGFAWLESQHLHEGQQGRRATADATTQTTATAEASTQTEERGALSSPKGPGGAGTPPEPRTSPPLDSPFVHAGDVRADTAAMGGKGERQGPGKQSTPKVGLTRLRAKDGRRLVAHRQAGSMRSCSSASDLDDGGATLRMELLWVLQEGSAGQDLSTGLQHVIAARGAKAVQAGLAGLSAEHGIRIPCVGDVGCVFDPGQPCGCTD